MVRKAGLMHRTTAHVCLGRSGLGYSRKPKDVRTRQIDTRTRVYGPWDNASICVGLLLVEYSRFFVRVFEAIIVLIWSIIAIRHQQKPGECFRKQNSFFFSKKIITLFLFYFMIFYIISLFTLLLERNWNNEMKGSKTNILYWNTVENTVEW